MDREEAELLHNKAIKTFFGKWMKEKDAKKKARLQKTAMYYHAKMEECRELLEKEDIFE